jgi:hypothetical protein
MLIDKDLLIKCLFEVDDIIAFEENFGVGAELIDIIKSDKVSDEFVQQLVLNFSLTDEDRYAYQNRMHIINSTWVHMSRNVKNSSCVTYSDKIFDSHAIRHSNTIMNSAGINESSNVRNSEAIFHSHFVTNSFQVYQSNNVTNSSNIVKSIYVIDSESVKDSQTVIDSRHIRFCNNVTGARSCMWCNNLKNAIFCTNAKDEEYLLFNKPISQQQFEIIKEQYDSFIDEKLTFSFDWPQEDLLEQNIFIGEPTILHNLHDHYKYISFNLDWIKTLPNYDPLVIYELTYNKSLI